MQKYASEHGMKEPRSVQKDGFYAILHTDKHVMISGPTSCGKTFAVYGAILSMVDFSETGVKVMDILPMKALANDQEIKVREMCDYIYVPVTKWHGDAKQSEKNKLLKNPSGVLLIIPESLEARFQNHPEQIDKLFTGLRYIVIDEIHHYYGSERGRQLISLLYRLQQRVGKARIIAMSATIGKNDTLAKSYIGDTENTLIVRDNSIRKTDFTIRYYSRDEEDDAKKLPEKLIEDVYNETMEKKGLVFCNSRGTTEEVAVALKKYEPGNSDNYGSHHSSVSKEERERIEESARQGKTTPCSTATMENGIDIGKTSKVCLVESPYSVSSFIQRSGRSGRENGISVVRMFCSDKWSLIRGIACWNLFNHGYAEAPDNSIEWHNVALQQIISTVKEKGAIDRDVLIDDFLGNPAFTFNSKTDYDAYIDYALETGVFEQSEVGHGIILGTESEKLVGKKDSYIVFPTTYTYQVMNQNNRIGEYELSMDDKKGDCFYLSSKVWQITGFDDQRSILHVIPASEGNKPKYTSCGIIVSKELEQEMKDILLSTDSYSFTDEKANEELSALRSEFSKCNTLGVVRMPYYTSEAGLLCIYPFAGTKIFNTLKLLFNAIGDGYKLSMNLSLRQFIEKCRTFIDTGVDLLPDIEKMITNGEITIRHRYEKFLPLKYQARMELSLNYDYKGTIEYIKQITQQL